MTSQRTATVNALTALLRAAPLDIDARRPLTAKQISEVACWRRRVEDLATLIARAEAIRLAKRVIDLNKELSANQTQMITLIRDSKAAELLHKTGIGPITVAVVYTAWSHAGRVRSDAAFAALAGVNPIPASSGNTTRHRLNRGGDRRLNRALHMAVITRMTHDPDTRAYVERRRAQGRTTKEVDAASSATSPASSTGPSKESTPNPTHFHRPLDEHRRVHRPHTAIGKLAPISRLNNLAGHHI